MTNVRIAPLAVSAAVLAALVLPAAAQNWPSNPPAAGPGQFPAAPAAAPAQPAPSPSAWGNSNAPQHPAWGQPGAASGGAAPAPSAFGGAPGMGMGMRPPGGPQGAPPCADEFMPLRNDAQTKGMAIKAAVDRKAERSEICKVFRTFVAAEAKVVKFVTDHGSRCSVPADAVKVMKTNHGKSVTMSNRVCNAATGPAAAPPPPSLSDALGTSRIPDSNTIKKGGTYDTLSGSPVQR